MRIRSIKIFLLLLTWVSATYGVADKVLNTPNTDEIVIAFGSCDDPIDEGSAVIFDTIAKFDPSIFVWLGDIAYTDDEGPIPYFYPWFDGPFPGLADYEAKINATKNDPPYAHFAKNRTIIGVWDDHDYGKNDGDKTFPYKNQTRQVWLDFLNEPKDSPRRFRSGMYESYYIGNEKLVKLILLDGRYNKDPSRYWGQDNLGEEQWAWLEQELRNNTAQVVLIASGYQILPDDRFTSETWFVQSQNRLLALIKSLKIEGVVLLSGDIHVGELSYHPCSYQRVGYNIYEVTSSGLTHTVPPHVEYLLSAYPPDTYRIKGTKLYVGFNFGLITVRSNNSRVVSIDFEVKGANGTTVLELKLDYDELLFNTSKPIFGQDGECVIDDVSRYWRSVRYHLLKFTIPGLLVTLGALALLVFAPATAVYLSFCIPLKVFRWLRRITKQKKD